MAAESHCPKCAAPVPVQKYGAHQASCDAHGSSTDLAVGLKPNQTSTLNEKASGGAGVKPDSALHAPPPRPAPMIHAGEAVPPPRARMPTLTGVGEVTETPAPTDEVAEAAAIALPSDRITSRSADADDDPVTLRAVGRGIVTSTSALDELDDEAARQETPGGQDDLEGALQADGPDSGPLSEPSAAPAQGDTTVPYSGEREVSAAPIDPADGPFERSQDDEITKIDATVHHPVASASQLDGAATPRCAPAGTCGSHAAQLGPRTPGAATGSLAPSTFDDPEERSSSRPTLPRTMVRPSAHPDRRPLAMAAGVGVLLLSAVWWLPRLVRTSPDRASEGFEVAHLPSPPSGARSPAASPQSQVIPAGITAEPPPVEPTTQPGLAASADPSPLKAGERPKSGQGQLPKVQGSAKALAQEPESAGRDLGDMEPDPPTRSARPFSERAASNAIAYVSGSLKECRDPAIGRISTRASITFMPSGHVSQVTLDPVPVLRGSPVVACVVRQLRQAVVPEFAGDRVTVSTIVTVE